jgi:hypothetical protein
MWLSHLCRQPTHRDQRLSFRKLDSRWESFLEGCLRLIRRSDPNRSICQKPYAIVDDANHHQLALPSGESRP